MGSAFIGLCVVLIVLPIVAIEPTSARSAELTELAFRGGVPRAPGYMLQAWLNRAFIFLPLPSYATRIALVSVLAHGAATALLVEAARRMSLSMTARILAAGAYALFPTTWSAATQAEPFALGHLLLALALAQAVRVAAPFYASTTSSLPRVAARGDALVLGATIGLALSLHVNALVALPAWTVTANALAAGPGGRRRVASAVVVGVAGALALAASAPLLRAGAVPGWPDWTATATAMDGLRAALGLVVDPSSSVCRGDGEPTSALAVFGRAFASRDGVALVLGLVGAALLVRARAWRVLTALGGTTALGLAALAAARCDGDADLTTAHLEPLLGVVVVPAALLAAIVVDAIAHTAGRRGPALAALLVIVVVAGQFLGGRARADSAHRAELRVLRLGVGAALPADAVWLTDDGIERSIGALADVVSGPGKGSSMARRWPIDVALASSSPWYVRDVLPVLEPRIDWRAHSTGVWSTAEIVEAALSRGLRLAATERRLVEATGARGRLMGFVWIADGALGEEITWATVEGAAVLCPFLDELEPIDEDAVILGRRTWSLAARAFDGAAQYLQNVDAASASEATALAAALDSRDWSRGAAQRCRALRIPVEAMRSDLRRSIVDDPNRSGAEELKPRR